MNQSTQFNSPDRMESYLNGSMMHHAGRVFNAMSDLFDLQEAEEWRTIKGFNDFYIVSNYGEVSSIDRCVLHGNSYRKRKGYKLKANPDKKGYLRVKFSYLGASYPRKVHRLVCEAFHDNPENKPTVNHINGIKTDNRAVNLEWATNKEQGEHASRNNLLNSVKGQKQWFSKLKDIDIPSIFKLYREGKTQTEIAVLYSITVGTIGLILKGKSWKHLYEKIEMRPREPTIRYGEQTNSKLKNKDILSIRQLRLQGKTLKYIADLYNVDVTNISCIVLRKTWKHIL